jgi:hypothetical protein
MADACPKPWLACGHCGAEIGELCRMRQMLAADPDPNLIQQLIDRGRAEP